MTHWHKFTDKLPEEGQAIVALKQGGDGDGFYYVSANHLVAISLITGNFVVSDDAIIVAFPKDYALWAPLPEGFKLWREE